jgi:hypothetical protein
MIKRMHRGWTLALTVFIALAGQPISVGLAGPTLSIELNKVEDTDQNSCVAAFVLRNDLGTALDRFSLDLYIFDSDGIIARQLVLDLAPLRNDKTTVVRFPLLSQACATIGRVLVNDIPTCRSAETGEDIDCLTALQVSSRDRIALTN